MDVLVPVAPPCLPLPPACSACFDFEFYKAHNPDLPVWGPETIWEHFVTSGQHEGRVFRWVGCGGGCEGHLGCCPLLVVVTGACGVFLVVLLDGKKCQASAV
jgi:hypothetical protein